MAVQAFKAWNRSKHNLSITSGILLGNSTFTAHLVTSASNFSTTTLSTLGSITSEVASGNNYVKSGHALTLTWTGLASAKSVTSKWTVNAFVWTATGGTIPNIRGVVLVAVTGASAKAAANKLWLYASLTSAQFTLAQNNTLTITPNASGCVTLA